MLPDRMGYIELPDLASDGVAGAVRDAVVALQRGGAHALVLDLRGNPGGRLVTMMQVAGIFTSGFLWRTVTRWTLPLPYPAVGTVATDLPLAVLIDGEVNSAAEGLAGALQARGRATVVGERSAGNVEAVLPFCLRDGSQAWIATGVLAPISGPTWEGRGVVPDVEVAPDQALEAAVKVLH
jgi:carboxyl-terminal processing protease